VTAPAPRAPDRRSQRTRDALRDALLELMAELGWEDVSVQNLCERAEVARSTF
jgi:AcrR family transcriptional regulator